MIQNLLRTLGFFAVFTSLYALVEGLVYLLAVKALGLGIRGRLWLGSLFLVLLLGPALQSTLLRRPGPWSWVIFLWLAFMFLAFCASLVAAGVWAVLGPKGLQPAFAGAVLAALVLTAGGVWEARSLRIHEVTLTTAKLPVGSRGFDLLVAGDLHLGSVETAGRLDRFLRVIEGLKFDLLILTGDVIDAGLDQVDWPALADRLAELSPPLGKFGVRGNHEVIADFSAYPGFTNKFYRRAGIRLLDDESVRLGDAARGYLRLVGLADQGWGPPPLAAVKAALAPDQDQSLFTLLLKHRPDPPEGGEGRFDLQLSGHTHAGQIWPFSLIVARVHRYLKGLYELEGGGRIFVTAGAGTWGPPVRVGTRPEVVWLKIRPRP